MGSLSSFIEKEFNLSSLYFNAAYFGPSPQRSVDLINKALKIESDPSFYAYSDWIKIPDQVRTEIAKLLEVSPNNISHSTSVSDIVSHISFGLDLDPGSGITFVEGDYPSNVLPWMALKQRRPDIELMGLSSRHDLNAEHLEKKLPKNTKVFCVSLVSFDQGHTINIRKIGKLLKERGIFFIVDATQALGGISLSKEDLKYIDALTCSTYKWLLGPYGHAFCYYSDECIKKLERTNTSWIVSKNSDDVNNLVDYTLDTLQGARKFDRGQSPNMLLMNGLQGALEFFNECGLKNIENHNIKIRNYFLENYPEKKYQLLVDKENLSTIVALKSLKHDSSELQAHLKKNNVDVSVRQGNIRLSFHVYNSKEDVTKLIKILDF